mmetsp:Transcript_41538/g.50536  ORF Transcript_41538/g.50536 Transcript_41538/m.50536 type:complete len:136 (+) Transcript_41538:71-478(+)
MMFGRNSFFLSVYILISLVIVSVTSDNSDACYKVSTPPFFVKWACPKKTPDDWVEYALNGWGARCCDFKTGKYEDNGWKCPLKGTRFFKKKMSKKICPRVAECHSAGGSRRMAVVEMTPADEKDMPNSMLRASSK